MQDEAVPPDLIGVGRVAGASGIRGEVKVQPYSDHADALSTVRQWWLKRDGRWQGIEVDSVRQHGDGLRAQFLGVTDRNTAETFKGVEIAIPRSRFPVPDENEFYWVDLIGLDVVTEAGERLGQVTALSEHAAHSVLEVATETGGQQLIPFVAAVIKAVDLAQRRITVAWHRDY